MAMQATDHLDLGAMTDQPQAAQAATADRGFDGGNKFQHAISAWRSMSSMSVLAGQRPLLLTTAHRS